MNWTNPFVGLIPEFRNDSGKNLFQNILSLSFLQISNYIIPLIILPYLIRVIGVEKYGLIVFAQAIMQYFVILTDYGFNLSATREISASRDDIAKVSEIFWSVSIIKFVLTLLAFGILILLISLTTKFGDNTILYYYTFGIVIGNLLFPVWLFQGLEKMKHSTALYLIGKIFYLITLFVFVREASDYLNAPLLYSAGLVLSGLIALVIIFARFQLRLVVPPIATIKYYFKDSTQFFLSQVSVSLYTTLNTVVLGFFTTNEIVGFYAAAEKVFIAMRSAMAPIARAVYPYMTSRRNLKLFKKIYYITLMFAVLIGAGIFLTSGVIVRIVFGPGMETSASVLRVFSILLPLAATSILLGFPFLAAVGYKKEVNSLLIIASVIHIALIASILPIIDPINVALVSLVTETAVVSMIVRQIRKHSLWHSIPETGQ